METEFQEILNQIDHIESLECDTRVECILMLHEIRKLKNLIKSKLEQNVSYTDKKDI